jgi:hypothetical protein
MRQDGVTEDPGGVGVVVFIYAILVFFSWVVTVSGLF